MLITAMDGFNGYATALATLAAVVCICAGCAASAADSAKLEVRRNGMTLSLIPAESRLTVNDGKAEWAMHSSRPGFAHLAVYTKEPQPAGKGLEEGFGPGKEGVKHEYTLGGPDGIPVNWRTEGNGIISGEGRLTNMDVSFKMVFRLLAGGRLQCKIDLNGADVGKIAETTFPSAPTVSSETSRLVIPQWLGLLVSPVGPDMRVQRSVWQRPWCMRFIGATRSITEGKRSYIAIAKDSLYRNVMIWRASNEIGFDYVGDRSYAEKSSSTRSQQLEFQFIDGDYVQIASKYREWAVQQPPWKSLATRKRKPKPEVVGGALFFLHVAGEYGGNATKFDTLIPRLKALKEAGVERAIFHIGGWNNKGYDLWYPDIFPANPLCGGDEGFRRLTDAIDDLGYMCVPHDDLGILLPAAPSFDEKWLARWPDGSRVAGGAYNQWPYYVTNSAYQAHFSGRNNPEVHKRYPNVHGYLYDYTTSIRPMEDYSSNPPLTKEQDIQGRREAFRIARDTFADFLVGESIVDWNIGAYDAAFMAEEGYVHRGDGGWAGDALHGEIVPMWEIVYHDVIIALRQSATDVNSRMDTDDPLASYLRLFLKTLRAGSVPPSFSADDLTMRIMESHISKSTTDMHGWSKLTTPHMLCTLSRLSTWLADDVFGIRMVDHKFIDGNLYHERTVFKGKAGATVVYINSDFRPWSPLPGVTLSGIGFYISGPGLIAYCADEMGGKRFSQPTLAAFKGKPRAGAKVMAYRAFGDDDLCVPTSTGSLSTRVQADCSTVSTVLK